MARTGNAVLALATAGLGVYLTARVFKNLYGYDFRGKAVVIAGGSRGLGLVMARKLAARGARLALIARREEELVAARDELRSEGASVETFVCDLTDADAVKRTMADVEGRLGFIDVLINNAAMIAVGPAEHMTLDDYHKTMDVNFWGVVNAVEAVLPGMRRRGRGRIVNIGSVGGKAPVPHLLPYCASKFALVGYTLGLRAETAKDGVVVTLVNPGLTRTGSPRHAEFKGQNQREHFWFTFADSFPLISQSAEGAAEAIIGACSRGDAELTLTLPAKINALTNALAPGLMADINALVNRYVLPGEGGTGSVSRTGAESETPTTRAVTGTNQSAADRNNQRSAEPAVN